MSSRLLGSLLALLVLLPSGAAHSQGSRAEQLEGYWAKRTRLESVTEVPVLGEISQETEVVSLIELDTDSNGELRYREKTCRLTSKTLGGMIRTHYPVRFLRMLERDWAPVQIEQTGDVLTLVQEKKPRTYGEGGDDQDGDGRPGVTIEVSGIIDGEIYASVREWSTSLGELTSPNQFEGRVIWDAALEIIDATSDTLRSKPKTRRKDDPEAHRFVMKRVRNTATCARLLRQLDDVF